MYLSLNGKLTMAVIFDVSMAIGSAIGDCGGAALDFSGVFVGVFDFLLATISSSFDLLGLGSPDIAKTTKKVNVKLTVDCNTLRADRQSVTELCRQFSI